jgi:hypothetical protein
MFDENQKSANLYAYFFCVETKRFGLVTQINAPSKDHAIEIAHARYPSRLITIIPKDTYDAIIEGTTKDAQAHALARFRLSPRRSAIL